MRKFTIFLALLLVIGMQGAFAQMRVISGVVTSSDDKAPIPGVTVLVKSSTIGTVTNIEGKYSITVPEKYNTLEFSYVGMKSQTIKLGTSGTIDVVLEPDVMKMEEVVVTAIGIPRETKALSYSVQNVSADDIAKSSQSDMINSLRGKVSDVEIVSSSGVAGAASYIQIRGVTSLTGNNQPLFVVDGVPIDGSGTGGDVTAATNLAYDGVALSNRAVDINPDDIESVSVLKGGAATALYGLRAASGAVIITTKKGHATTGKKVSVNFSTSVKFDVVSNLPPRQDEFGQGSNIYDQNTGEIIGLHQWRSGNKFSWGPRLDTCAYDRTGFNTYQWNAFDVDGRIVSNKVGKDGSINTYNPYDFFQTGLTTDNSLSLSGGSDVSTFYFSFSDNQSKGIVPNNKLRRNTFKLSGDTKLSDHFKVAGSANYIITAGDRIQQGNNTSGVMLGLLRTPPTFNNAAGYQLPSNYQFPDGSGTLTDWQNLNISGGDPTATGLSGNQRSYRHGIFYDNPYWTANNNQYKDAVNRLIGSAEVDYLANKWLSFTYRIGIDWWGRKFTDNLAIGSSTQPAGWAKRGEELAKNFNSDLIMTIDKNFAKDFNVHFILGQNMTQNYYTNITSQAFGMVIPHYYDLNNTTSVASQELTTNRKGAGIYGDLTLSWKYMLYLTATGRNDWSTTLPEGKNSFFYPSIGAGWIFTQLDGLKENKVLPYGKVRVSYSIIAKDAPAYYTTTNYATPLILDGWTTGLTWPFLNQNGYLLTNVLGNTGLKPEKTTNFETGIDLKFVQNRIGLSYTYFNNKTVDNILQVPISASTGYNFANLNAGSIRTTGHEVTLDLVPIKSKNWNWDITVNFAKTDNKVLKLADGVNRLYLGGFTGSEIDAVVGQPYRTIYGYDWLRDSRGNVLIGDDGYPMMSENESALGNVDPKWTMGIATNLTWKDLSLYLLVDIKHGGKMWNGTRGAMDYFGTSAGTLNRGDYVTFEGVVQSTGQVNTMSVPLTQEWYQGVGSGFVGCTAPYIEDAGWVRLRTVTLSYDLTKFLKKTFVRQLSVYFTGTNLWLLTNYKGIDPETSLSGSGNAQGVDYFNMPGTKSYTLGLTMAF